jgi:hypothetical protein
MHAAMFRTLQDCMAELAGIRPREQFSPTDTEVRIYQVTLESYVELTYLPETEFTRIYATMPRPTSAMLGPARCCLLLANSVTVVQYRQFLHNDPD